MLDKYKNTQKNKKNCLFGTFNAKRKGFYCWFLNRKLKVAVTLGDSEYSGCEISRDKECGKAVSYGTGQKDGLADDLTSQKTLRLWIICHTEVLNIMETYNSINFK